MQFASAGIANSGSIRHHPKTLPVLAARAVRRVLFDVLGVITDIELVAAGCAVVAPCGFDRQLEARDPLPALRSACPADDDIGELLHQAFAERRN